MLCWVFISPKSPDAHTFKGFSITSEVPTQFFFTLRLRTFSFVRSMFLSFSFFNKKNLQTSAYHQVGGGWVEPVPVVPLWWISPFQYWKITTVLKETLYLYCQSHHTKVFHFMALFWCTLATAQVPPAAVATLWMADCFPLELLWVYTTCTL